MCRFRFVDGAFELVAREFGGKADVAGCEGLNGNLPFGRVFRGECGQRGCCDGASLRLGSRCAGA